MKSGLSAEEKAQSSPLRVLFSEDCNEDIGLLPADVEILAVFSQVGCGRFTHAGVDRMPTGFATVLRIIGQHEGGSICRYLQKGIYPD